MLWQVAEWGLGAADPRGIWFFADGPQAVSAQLQEEGIDPQQSIPATIINPPGAGLDRWLLPAGCERHTACA